MKLHPQLTLASLAFALTALVPAVALASSRSAHVQTHVVHDHTPHVHQHGSRAHRS